MTTFAHVPSLTAPPFQPPDDVIAWLRGKTPEELHAIEHPTGDGRIPRVLFPDVLRYRNSRGESCEVPVLFKIPTDDDLAAATAEAVKHVAERIAKVPKLTRAEAVDLVGPARFENFDTAALVSICALDPKNPAVRAYQLWLLLADFLPDSIADAFERIELLRRTWSIRASSLTEAQFWGLCAELARVKNISPLAGLAPALQGAFMVRLAEMSMNCRMKHSSSGSSDSSTPE